MPEESLVKHVEQQFNPNDPASLYMRESVFAQLQRVAKLMASSSLVPVHLQGDDKVADCFLVAAQALRWKLDPFGVAQSCYVLNGKLGYEGKLIAAVVNSRLLQGGGTSLNYEYSGSGLNREVRVFAKLKGEDKPREVCGTVEKWKTDRNPKWKDLPDQMLSYRGAREWARRHMPEAVLGVFSVDEIEEIAYTKAPVEIITPESLEAFTSPAKVEASDDPKRPAPVSKIEEPIIEATLVKEGVVTGTPEKLMAAKTTAAERIAALNAKKKKEEKRAEEEIDPKDAAIDKLF